MSLPLRLAAIAALCAGFSGCNSLALQYPEYRERVSIAVSTDDGALSIARPAGGYQVPASHVFVWGKAGATAVGGAFGVLGVLTGFAIDQSRNAAAIADIAPSLQVEFDGMLRDKLREQSHGATGELAITLETDETKADVILAPFAEIFLLDAEHARVFFKVLARVRIPGTTDRAIRTYYYDGEGNRPLAGPEGIARDGGGPLKAAAQRAMGLLASVIAQDIRGRFKGKISADPLEIIDWKPAADNTGEPVTSLLLADLPNQFVVTPMLRGRFPIRGQVWVVEKWLVRAEPTRPLAAELTRLQ